MSKMKTRILLAVFGLLSTACISTLRNGTLPLKGVEIAENVLDESTTNLHELSRIYQVPEYVTIAAPEPGNVYLRETPENSGRILTILHSGDSVSLLAVEGDWLLVDAGIIGWVYTGCTAEAEKESCR